MGNCAVFLKEGSLNFKKSIPTFNYYFYKLFNVDHFVSVPKLAYCNFFSKRWKTIGLLYNSIQLITRIEDYSRLKLTFI
jgi:hypothetical protein